MSMFKPATREQLKARIALDAPTGGGKTYTGLAFAFALAGPNGRVCVIDTENRSASKYVGYAPHGIPWQFQVCDLKHFAPSTYTAAIREAANCGFDVVLIDSLSHAWEGVGGALDQVDKKAAQNGNSFTAWKDVTPQHREMIEAILSFPGHVIAAMRTKMEYVLEEITNASGKKVMSPKKVGLAPIQRQGMEYEFDIVCDLDTDHMLKVSKTRCPEIDGMIVSKPGPEFMSPVIKWLNEGAVPMQPVEEVGPAPLAEAPVFNQAMTSQPVVQDTNGHASSGLNAPATQFKPTSTSEYSPCDEGQQDRIMALVSRIGEAKNWKSEASIAWLKALLAKKGKAKRSDLTVGEAISLIGFLETTLTKAEMEMLVGDGAK